VVDGCGPHSSFSFIGVLHSSLFFGLDMRLRPRIFSPRGLHQARPLRVLETANDGKRLDAFPSMSRWGPPKVYDVGVSSPRPFFGLCEIFFMRFFFGTLDFPPTRV